MSEHRTGWLVSTDDGVVVGDPYRDHLLLTVDGLAHRRPDLDAASMVTVSTWVWSDVADLLVSAPTSRTSKPGLWAFLRAALAEATGWASTLASADVHVRVVAADGTDDLLTLDGHPGGGYPADEQDRAHVLLRRVLDAPSALTQVRILIARPEDRGGDEVPRRGS